jgi:hypothetical protein
MSKRSACQLIAIRLDAKVLARFRKEARRRGVGFPWTLMRRWCRLE